MELGVSPRGTESFMGMKLLGHGEAETTACTDRKNNLRKQQKQPAQTERTKYHSHGS